MEATSEISSRLPLATAVEVHHGNRLDKLAVFAVKPWPGFCVSYKSKKVGEGLVLSDPRVLRDHRIKDQALDVVEIGPPTEAADSRLLAPELAAGMKPASRSQSLAAPG